MKKLNKKSASLAALQIGTALSPLTVLAQASADTVDDAVAKAESAGLKVRVEDKGDVKVNSKAEADTKNAEADAQLKADAVNQQGKNLDHGSDQSSSGCHCATSSYHRKGLD